VLRRWKSLGGAFFDKRVLKADTTLEARLAGIDLTAIVPIPQDYDRSWRLGGSPTQRIARFLANLTGIPIINALTITSPKKKTQQAELSAEKRFENRIQFSLRKQIGGEAILLVDDFFTTGHTLRSAASTLYWGGSRNIHVFCLGIRPNRFYFRSQSTLPHCESASSTAAISNLPNEASDLRLHLRASS